MVGSNDVDKVAHGPGKWLEVEEQSRQLTSIAMAAATDYNAEMLVSHRIPRCGGDATLARLTTVANSCLETMVTTAETGRLHLVRHNNLGDLQGLGHKDLYSDPKHLSDKGKKKLAKNLVSAILSVYPVKEKVKKKEEVKTKDDAKKRDEVKVKEVKVKEKKEVASLVGARKEGTGMGPRKSRSKERPRANNNNNNNSSSNSNGSLEVLLARLRKVMTMTIHRGKA